MFPTSVTIDLAIAAALALCILLGRKRGLFRSFMGFAAVVIALILASRAAQFGSDLVISHVLRPVSAAAIEKRVDEMLAEPVFSTSPLGEMEQIVAAIPSAFVRERAGQLLEKMEMSTEQMLTHSARETLLEMGMGLLDTVLDTAVRGVLHALIFLVSFLLVTMALKIVTRAMDLTLKLPLLRQVNEFGGLLFGTVEGVVLVCAAVGLLGRAELWVTPEAIEASFLLKFVARWIGLAA